MEAKVCQSCGMPMTTAAEFGTNKNGSVCEDYCVYCFKDGDFTSEETMEGMIEQCSTFPEALKDENGKSISKEQFVVNMTMYFSTLKRWKKQ